MTTAHGDAAMMNERAVDLWRRYQAETDPQAAEMLYLEYLQALDSKNEEAMPRRDEGPRAA
jgi:hypothetical protein